MDGWKMNIPFENGLSSGGRSFIFWGEGKEVVVGAYQGQQNVSKKSDCCTLRVN